MTDHKPLTYLFGMKDPSTLLVKFRLQIEEYNYKLVYVCGKHNNVADDLSKSNFWRMKNLNETTLVMT